MYPSSLTVWSTEISELITSPLTLSIKLAGTNALLSWSGSVAGYHVQSTPSLSPTNWTLVAQTPTLSNGQYTVSVPATGIEKLFRLIK